MVNDRINAWAFISVRGFVCEAFISAKAFIRADIFIKADACIFIYRVLRELLLEQRCLFCHSLSFTVSKNNVVHD